MNCEVWAVIVTYNPDIAVFESGLSSLLPQVAAVVVVDNASRNISEIRELTGPPSCRLVTLPDNQGIAHAQNIGIELGVVSGATHILFLDQDTILRPRTVSRLVAFCSSLQDRKIQVGSVGNFYRDIHDARLNDVWRAKGFSLYQEHFPTDRPVVAEADFIIASGALMPVVALQKVGLMDAGLFIDLVDVEWGLRAGSMGFRHFLQNRDVMRHAIGSARRKFFGKSVTLHHPIRDYYALRNSILLARRPYIPSAWRLYFLRRIFTFFIGFVLLGDQRPTRIRLMLQGLRDGLFGRNGKCRSG